MNSFHILKLKEFILFSKWNVLSDGAVCSICIVNQVCLCQQDIIYLYYGMFGLSIPGATFLNTIKTGIQIYYDIEISLL